MPATALIFYLILTDLYSSVVVLNDSVDAMPLQTSVGLLLMQSVSDSIVYGFLFQNPVQSPIRIITDSTEFWKYSLFLLFMLLLRLMQLLAV